jgi:hypothetical protein
MPINKFTTLLDLARQAKILTGETATFDGKIQVGIPFSGYPTGVDTGTTVSLGIVSSQSAVFSGDTGTTVFDTSNPSSPYYDPSFDSFSAFTWSNPLFSAYTSGLTLPITFLSADTQIVGPFWTLTQTGNTGDYIIGTEYTGYSITYSFFNVISLNTGSTLFSGFTTASQENFSAGTLDYKGPLDYLSSKEDATIDGRLTTNKITITNGASASTIGYVLTQTGQNGEGEWQLSTGGTSVNIYNSDGMLTGVRIIDMNTYPLAFSGGSSDLFMVFLSTADKHLQWSESGALNWDMIVTTGTNDFKLERYDTSGSYQDTPITVEFSGGNVGINQLSPTETLDVNGKIKTINFQMTSGATNGYVLTSDGSGNATWQTPTGGGGTFTGGTVSALTNFISGLTTNEFTGNLGSSKTFYVSGNANNAEQIKLVTTFNPNNPAILRVGNAAIEMYSESGSSAINSYVNVGDGDVVIGRESGGSPQQFRISVTDGIKIIDDINLIGIVYDGDYSSNYTNRSLVDKEYVDNQVGGVPAATTATTTTINFTGQTIYYDAASPGTGNISENLTGSKLGLIQKIYHNDVSEPTYPAGWVLMGDAIYFTSTLNVIYAEWAGGTRVEYWYVQEQ